MKKYLSENKVFSRDQLLHKTYKIMLATLILLISGVFQAGANDRQQELKISLSLKNVSLEHALMAIEKQSDLKFLYRSDQVDVSKVVSVEVENSSLEETLKKLLRNARIGFEVVGKQIILLPIGTVNPKPASTGMNSDLNQQELASASLIPYLARRTADDHKISGRVLGENGEPQPGVNVVLKGTTIGTLTDISGNFSLAVPDAQGTLVFSYIGFVSEEVPINNQSIINVTLVPDIQSLSEVVVIGYGTQERKDVTGSIVSISSEEITKQPITSFDQAIQGRAPGVFVTQSSGQPGAPVSIQIRGAGRPGNTEPLYVIDGMIIQGADGGSENGLASLNSNDIESIEILKDASAAAVYGARAANGVVLITTKRGKSGEARVNFDAYYGIQQPWKYMDVLNTEQYINFINTSKTNGGESEVAKFSDPELLKTNTDWQKVIFRTAPIQNYNLNVSGGTDKSSFLLSGGFMNQEGIMIVSGFKRYSLRVNADFKIGKRIKIGESLQLSRTEHQVNDGGGEWHNPINTALRLPPYLNPYNENNEGGLNGLDASDGGSDLGNPLVATLIDSYNRKNRAMSTIYGELELIKGLKYRINLGLDVNYNFSGKFTPTYYAGSYSQNNFPSVERGNFNGLNLLVENMIMFDRSFGNHNVSAVAGVTEQKIKDEWYNLSTQGLPNNNVTVPGAGAASDSRRIGGGNSEYVIKSQFLRVNYEFMSKYLLSATIRRDGSSKFGKNNKYGVFPAFSAGWRVSEENFMKDVALISDLKLYGSWGQLGNDVGLQNYQDQSYVSGGYNYNFKDAQGKDILAPGMVPIGLANPGLRWESTTTSNFGVNLGLLQNKIILNAEYYIKRTDNLLIGVPIPVSSGQFPPPLNAGLVKNNGIDVALTYQNSAGELKYTVTGNISAYKNEVVSMGSRKEPIVGGGALPNNTIQATRTEVGQPIGSFYGYIMDGIFQDADDVSSHATQGGAQPGDIKFRDINGRNADGKLTGTPDGKIDSDDQTYIGNPMPNFSYGLNLNASFKGFDASLFLQGVQGNDIFNVQGYTFGAGYQGRYNAFTRVLDAWTPQNKSNTNPRVYSTDQSNFKASTRMIEDGSYMRIKNFQIGYSLPASILKSLGNLARIRVYVSSQNLVTLTKYSGFDPEIGSYRQQNTERGMDVGQYPQARTFLVGLQVGF